MSAKPSYERLRHSVKDLEKLVSDQNRMKDTIQAREEELMGMLSRARLGICRIGSLENPRPSGCKRIRPPETARSPCAAGIESLH